MPDTVSEPINWFDDKFHLDAHAHKKLPTFYYKWEAYPFYPKAPNIKLLY